MRPILVVNDDPDALALTQRALAKAGVRARCDVIADRRHAITYLRQRLARGEDALPFLTFLDLEMPGSDGFAVLQWIRHQPRLRSLLRVVLSSSLKSKSETNDSARCYRGATGMRTIFQLANAVLSIDEVEALVLPGLMPKPAPSR